MKVQFLVLLSSRIASTAIQAVVFVLLARWAGAQDFGAIAIIAGVAAVLFTVSDWGLSSYIPRARAKGFNAEVAIGLRMDLLGNLAAGALFAVAVAIFAPAYGFSVWLGLVPFALAVEQFIEVGLTVPIADGAKAILAISLLMRRLITLGVFLALFQGGVPATSAYCIGVTLGAAVGLAHVLRVLRRRLPATPDRVPIRSLYRTLTPYFLANLSSQVRTLDTAIVGAVTSVGSAGLYSAAFRLVNPLMLVSSSVAAVVLPHASRHTLPAAKRLGMRLTLAAILFSLPLVPVVIYAEPIVVLLFGTTFSAAAPAFAWAVAAIPFLSLTSPLGGVLQSQGHEKYVAMNGIILAIVTLGLVLLGALAWGPSGAAAGVTAAYTFKTASLLLRLLYTKAAVSPSAPRMPASHQDVTA